MCVSQEELDRKVADYKRVEDSLQAEVHIIHSVPMSILVGHMHIM